MASVSSLDVYEVGYLCGGAERVALAAVVAMSEDGRITISRTRHRVQVARRRASQPVERAVLDAVPNTGQVLGQLLRNVAHSIAVLELIDGLRQHGLVGRHWMAGHPHLSAAGRKARAELEDPAVPVPRERRVAVLGASGITEPGLRDIFETPDPPPGPRQLSKTRKTAGPYNDVPPDTHLPMQPGISGRW